MRSRSRSPVREPRQSFRQISPVRSRSPYQARSRSPVRSPRQGFGRVSPVRSYNRNLIGPGLRTVLLYSGTGSLDSVLGLLDNELQRLGMRGYKIESTGINDGYIIFDTEEDAERIAEIGSISFLNDNDDQVDVSFFLQ